MIEQEKIQTHVDWRQEFDDHSIAQGVEHVLHGKPALFILYDWNHQGMVRTLVYFDTQKNQAIIEKPEGGREVPLESHAIALLRKITVLASRELDEQREFPDVRFAERNEGSELSQRIQENAHTRIPVPLTTEPATRHYVLFHEKVRGSHINLPSDVLGPYGAWLDEEYSGIEREGGEQPFPVYAILGYLNGGRPEQKNAVQFEKEEVEKGEKPHKGIIYDGRQHNLADVRPLHPGVLTSMVEKSTWDQ
jgi:hypothetical protein